MLKRLNAYLKYFIIYWLPPIAWMAFLFPTNDTLTTSSTSHIIVPVIKWFLPAASQDTVDILHILVRKVVHFCEYAFLAFLLFRAFRGGKKDWRLKWTTYAGLITIGYGSLDEFLQTFIPSRTGSIYDWIIDSAGSVFALGIIYMKVKR